MENEATQNNKARNRVLRLAKPVRKGLLHLLFSRILLVVLLFALQIMIIVSIFVWLNDYVPHFTVFVMGFTLLMVIVLFNIQMDEKAKLTWMLIIAVIPVFGAILLLFTKTNTGHRMIRKRTEELIGSTKKTIPQSGTVAAELERDGSGMDDLGKYLRRSGCFPVYYNKEARYFPSGEQFLEAVIEEISKAEEYIFLESFIIEEGEMWGRVLKILQEKAEEGIDVRVMYDGMCDIANLPVNYAGLLLKQEILAKKFSPIRPIVSSHYNYRDHRKILVIDGKTAFTGGVNFADEYINVKERFGHWKDAAIMVRGEAALTFTLLFLQMWNIDEKEAAFPYLGEERLAAQSEGALRDGYILPYGDCPLDEDKVGETIYMDILYRANDYVHIMTPYLILDGELTAALKYAAERGIDVKIILPGIPDKKTAYALAKSHYKELISSGVEIYEYEPGFVHAKIFVSDDKKAVVGTINLDYRSLYHHFEDAVYLYKASCIADVEADFCRTLEKCRRVTPETIRNEKLYYRVGGWILKFLAPLM